MKKGMKIFDENGVDVQAMELTPVMKRLIELSDGLPPGRVMSMNAVTAKIKAGDSTIRHYLKMPVMEGRSIHIQKKLFVCSLTTYREYNEKA